MKLAKQFTESCLPEAWDCLVAKLHPEAFVLPEALNMDSESALALAVKEDDDGQAPAAVQMLSVLVATGKLPDGEQSERRQRSARGRSSGSS